MSARSVRLLLSQGLCQSELVEELGVAQSSASRSLGLLRAVGLVAPLKDGRRQPFTITAKDQTLAVFLAFDRFAEQMIEQDRQARVEHSRQTRRTAVRPACDLTSGEGA